MKEDVLGFSLTKPGHLVGTVAIYGCRLIKRSLARSCCIIATSCRITLPALCFFYPLCKDHGLQDDGSSDTREAG